MTVKLGCGLRLPWAVPPDGGRAIGTVRQGLEFGHLVRLPGGRYAQVNGDVVQHLNPFRVRVAIRNAVALQDAATTAAPRKKAGPQPIVIVRKKRRTMLRDEAPV